MEKAAKKAVARTMKEESVRKINEIGRNPNNVFTLVRKMKIESTDVVGGRCMQGDDGTLSLNENRAKRRKSHMSEIMTDKNEWDQIADADAVEGPIERVMREEIMEALIYLKIGKMSGPTGAYTLIILASGDVGIRELMEQY